MIVENAKSESLTISGRRIKVNYSTSQHIVHRNEGMSTTVENKVLLFTVYKQDYPITVDVAASDLLTTWHALRIAIFRKFHLHALVEFSRVEDAIRAKRNLNGADIYSGCCTIKVDYSVSQSVITVTRNDRNQTKATCNLSSHQCKPRCSISRLISATEGCQQFSVLDSFHHPHANSRSFWATPPTLPVLLDQF
uniref:RRM_8 domain-containing protein n=1 Tax=Macrostomum lignano TaxID=282301 RepID=A0A1I8FTA9_9PLAT